MNDIEHSAYTEYTHGHIFFLFYGEEEYSYSPLCTIKLKRMNWQLIVNWNGEQKGKKKVVLGSSVLKFELFCEVNENKNKIK